MSYQVAEEAFASVQSEIADLFSATRQHAVPARRFEWLYQQNPDGPAVIWTIRKSATGELAGFTVGLPRRMYVDRQIRTCWNGGDFSIYPRFRTLGIAAKLRRAAKEGVDLGRVDFLYSHPNERMELVHQQVGHRRVGTMVRYAKPLRTHDFLQSRIRSRALVAVASRVLDPVLSITSREKRHRARHATRYVHCVRFEDSADELAQRLASVRPIVGVRDARYLNWRYADNPLHESHAILAENQSRLEGFAIFMVKDRVAHLCDLCAGDSSGTQADLIAGLIDHCRTEGLQSISAVLLEGHTSIGLLEQFGFRRRSETTEMYGYAPEGSALAERLYDPRQWHVGVGDRDV
jgi:hypothetical protein